MSSRIVHIKAEDLQRKQPAAECCDCVKSIEDAASPGEVWTIYHGKLIYCPECAAAENIGPDT